MPVVDDNNLLKGFHFAIGSGFYVKKGTPEPVVETLHRALTKVMFDGELRTALTAMGQDLSEPLRLDEAAKVYAEDIKTYRDIAKAIGLKAQ